MEFQEIERPSHTFKVLSIDAWADGDEGWTWNDWHYVGEVTLADDAKDEEVIAALVDGGFATERARTEGEIFDDQYNWVLQQKADGKPVFAVEYGPVFGL